MYFRLDKTKCCLKKGKKKIKMFRRSFINFQLGKRSLPGSPTQQFDPKKQFRDHHRDMESSSSNLNQQRPAPAWKLPQLVNINKSCPPGLGGKGIILNQKENYKFDGFAFIGAAFQAHQKARLRKQNNSNEDSQQRQNQQEEENLFLFHDQHCMVIGDAYPKSTFHFLILPRISVYPKLNSIADVTEKDISLLRHMDSVGAEIVKSIYTCSNNIPSLARRMNISDEDEILEKILLVGRNNEKTGQEEEKDMLRDWLFRPRSAVSHLHPVSKLRFMSGFHTLPSLCPLHLHLTSLDMQSDCLKNKKHYNTFTTGFFVSRTRVEEEIAKHRYVRFAVDHEEVAIAERLENQNPMICAWCQFQCKSMPELKKHLVECKSNGCYFVQNTTLASR
jgi:hypothetical protein